MLARLGPVLEAAGGGGVEPTDGWNPAEAAGATVELEALERCGAVVENFEAFVGYLAGL